MQLYTEFGRLTKHGSPVHIKLKKVNDLYPLKWSGFNHSDFEKGIEKVLGPLSLFSPTSQEDEAPVIEQLQLTRPVTPIDEEIKVQPQTIDQLIQYIRRRIMAKTDAPFLSIEDQKNMAAIIISEVNGIWPDVRKQIDDPFLTVQENKELCRRITVYIVTVCEKLFQHYLQKAQVLNSRGVFSGPANTSRLKVQLALETSELLNILKIRRHIINDIKTLTHKKEDAEVSPRSVPPSKIGSKLTYKAMLEDRRSRINQHKPEMSSVEHEMKELECNMPVLDASHLTELLANLPRRETQPRQDHHTKQSPVIPTAENIPKVSKDAHENKIILKRCRSQPELHVGESILDEICIEHDVKTDKHLSLELELLLSERQRITKDVMTKSKQVQALGRDFIQTDLRNLTEQQHNAFLFENIEDELPPLVQAITRHAKHDDLKQRMEKQLNELQKRQKIREEEECMLVRGPDHPQPDTVSAHLGKTGVIRTSDIRVSERVCMSSITLRRHATIYNDLLDEIDHVTVKNLDANLELSDEIHEVYKEIMKTVPATHMDLDDLNDKDPLVMNAPESIDITNTRTSAALFYRGPKRVINPVFIRATEPPWADSDWKQWSRTPIDPPKDIKGEEIFEPMIPDVAKIKSFLHSYEQMKKTSKPSSTDEKMFHSYTSWLQWWKSTMTGDDYMKYLSIQETDFLGAVFHIYDSDDDDDDDDEESVSEVPPNKLQYFSRRSQLSANKVSAEEKERLTKLEELRNLKSEFKEGFWNANSVLMGGLGRDPELEEIKSTGNRGVRIKDPPVQNQAEKHRKSPDKKERLSSLSQGAKEKYQSETPASDSQERLESVWQRLQMPDSHRLDMAIKYSCNNYFSKLSEAIERWEAVCELILQRETLLIHLEKFERQASDPNRFFAKDSKNSTHRLEESRQRAKLYKKIDDLDLDIKEEIEYIQSHFQDVITYRGRPYLDKMKWDRTEMLYWLAEERKQNGLKYESITQGLKFPLRPAQLQSILPSKH